MSDSDPFQGIKTTCSPAVCCVGAAAYTLLEVLPVPVWINFRDHEFTGQFMLPILERLDDTDKEERYGAGLSNRT